MAETTIATMAEMVCERDVLLQNRSVEETSQKHIRDLSLVDFLWFLYESLPVTCTCTSTTKAPVSGEMYLI